MGTTSDVDKVVSELLFLGRTSGGRDDNSFAVTTGNMSPKLPNIKGSIFNVFTTKFKNYNVLELGFTDDRYFFLTVEENDISITCADGKTLEFVYIDPETNEELVNEDLNDLYNEIDLL